MTLAVALETFSGIVDSIYRAAFDPVEWETVARLVTPVTGSVLSAFYISDLTSLDVPVYYGHGMPPNYVEMYLRVAHLLPFLPELVLCKPGDVLVQSRTQPDEEFFKSQFFREFVGPLGLRDAMSVITLRSGPRMAGFASNTAMSRAPYTADEVDFMRLLAPHMCRAMTISDLLEMRKVKSDAIEAALDGLSAGVFLLDSSGRVLHLNQAAERMVADGNVVTIRDRKLLASYPQSNHALTMGLADGAKAGTGSEPSIALLSTGPAQKGMIATLLPLEHARQSAGLMSQSARWAVFVQDPHVAMPMPGEAFAKLHNLTPSELRVSMALAPGLSPDEAANVLGLSLPTVRSHLQRIFAKTGTSRQIDLVRLMMSAAPPTGGGRG